MFKFRADIWNFVVLDFKNVEIFERHKRKHKRQILLQSQGKKQNCLTFSF